MTAHRKTESPHRDAVDEALPGASETARAGDGHSGEAPGTTAGQVAGQESGELSDLHSALEEAQRELDRHREAMLRLQAEMDNQRKRLAREAEKSRKFALEGIMKDLLQVRDSLERGLEVDEQAATVEGLRQGKALTLRVLSKVMQDHGLEAIDPKGEPFDPEWHEAMSMVPTADHPENTVVEVLQKGFRLHDRLIRPAMVVVSRPPD